MDCKSDTTSSENPDTQGLDTCTTLEKGTVAEKRAGDICNRDQLSGETSLEACTVEKAEGNYESEIREEAIESTYNTGSSGLKEEQNKRDSFRTADISEDKKAGRKMQTQRRTSSRREKKSRLGRGGKHAACNTSTIINREFADQNGKSATLEQNRQEVHEPVSEKDSLAAVENHTIPWHRQLGLSSDCTTNETLNGCGLSALPTPAATQNRSRHPSMPPHTGEAVFIHVIKTDKLLEDPSLINPVLRIHAVDYTTGGYWSNTTGSPQVLRWASLFSQMQ